MRNYKPNERQQGRTYRQFLKVLQRASRDKCRILFVSETNSTWYLEEMFRLCPIGTTINMKQRELRIFGSVIRFVNANELEINEHILHGIKWLIEFDHFVDSGYIGHLNRVVNLGVRCKPC